MKQKVNVRNLSLMALFAALTAVGAFITIPVPPVPFSLQIFFAILAGALLGSRQGAMSIVIYLLLGLCGLPVFTKGAGLSYLLQPTFGYLLGFVPAAWLCGKSSRFEKQQLSDDAGGLFFGSRCGFCRRVRILCTDYQPLAGKGDKCRSNLLFDLSDFCAGGYPADGLGSLFRQSLAADSAAGAVDFPLSCLPCIFPQKGI